MSHLARIATLALLVMVVACSSRDADHTAYDSPDEAITALVDASRSGDVATLRKIFGPGAGEIVDSGDPVADRLARERFLELYDAKHQLVDNGADRKLLTVGEESWPLPVPLERHGGRWRFDGADGADEVVFRRIGRNELGAIAVCRGYIDAQTEYAAEDRDGEGAGIYAQKLLSDPGLRNGLYWETGPGEPPSPVGQFVASAAAEGYRSGGASAYHGYRYRPLFRQGENANGGALDYFDNGVLVRGFALVAWPADYGVSGVMTFIVNQDGVVFQKDLGENTDAAVEQMQAFDPDQSWTAVTEGNETT